MTLSLAATVIATTTLAFTLAISAGAKIVDMRSFAGAVRGFRLLPPRWASGLARVTVTLEVLAVVLLFLQPLTGGILAALLLLGFTGALWRALRMHLAVTCNCFGGAGSPRVSYTQVVRNVVLLLLCVVAILGSTLLTWTWAEVAVNAGAVASMAGASLVAAVAFSQFEAVTSIFRSPTAEASTHE